MALSWFKVAEVIAKVASAYYDHRQHESDVAQRERDREAILAAIVEVQDNLLSAVLTERLDELRAEVAALHDRYATYDPDPSSVVEEERLRDIIDTSSSILSRLGVEFIDDMDTLEAGPATEAGLDAWPPYVAMVYLRAQAMHEREFTYGADEAKDIRPMFLAGLDRLNTVLRERRRRNAERFSDIECRETPDLPDVRQCSYRFGGRSYVCGSLKIPDGIARCHAARDAHMDRELPTFDGVPAVLDAQADLLRELTHRDDRRPSGPAARHRFDTRVTATANEATRSRKDRML